MDVSEKKRYFPVVFPPRLSPTSIHKFQARSNQRVLHARIEMLLLLLTLLLSFSRRGRYPQIARCVYRRAPRLHIDPIYRILPYLYAFRAILQPGPVLEKRLPIPFRSPMPRPPAECCARARQRVSLWEILQLSPS